MIVVDSDIWIYFLDATHRQHRAVRRHLPPLLRAEPPLIPSVIQMEVVHYLRQRMRARGEPLVEAWTTMDAEVRDLDTETVLGVTEQMARSTGRALGARDAVLLYHALHEKAKLATHDRALARTATSLGIEVVDPVRAAD